MNHSFNIEHAKKYGVNSAIILNNMIFWIAKNRANGKNQHDGRTWTFNSVRAWSELFSYLSEKQIRTAIEKLIEVGVLIKGNYNEKGYDRTLWYAFKDESIYLDGIKPLPSKENGFDQQVEPIPDINKDINKDINNNASKDADKKLLDKFAYAFSNKLLEIYGQDTGQQYNKTVYQLNSILKRNYSALLNSDCYNQISARWKSYRADEWWSKQAPDILVFLKHWPKFKGIFKKSEFKFD